MFDGLKKKKNKTSCLKFHDLVPTGVPSFTSYYFPCYTLCYSSSKLHTLALCSGCAHSLESPGLAYSSFLMAQLCQALKGPLTLLPSLSAPTQSLLWSVSLPGDCWLLESWAPHLPRPHQVWATCVQHLDAWRPGHLVSSQHSGETRKTQQHNY